MNLLTATMKGITDSMVKMVDRMLNFGTLTYDDLSLPNSILNAKIYRYMSVARLFDLFSKKELVLLCPKKWDDPMEDLLSKTKVKEEDGTISGFALTNDYFGQCWTTKEECDGFWRNYASLDAGVRIESTIGKVFKVLFKDKIENNNIKDNKDDTAHLTSFIGKVIYGEPLITIDCEIAIWLYVGRS